VEAIKNVDEKYGITEKTAAAGAKAAAKIQEIDQKYEISARTSAIVSAGAQKIRELDEKHRISERAAATGEQFVTYAREIDAKYAISATTGRIVEAGKNAIIAALERAAKLDEDHKITERTAAAIAAGATIVAHQVSKLAGTGAPVPAPASADFPESPAVEEVAAESDGKTYTLAAESEI
jgi:hypothetical protein